MGFKFSDNAKFAASVAAGPIGLVGRGAAYLALASVQILRGKNFEDQYTVTTAEKTAQYAAAPVSSLIAALTVKAYEKGKKHYKSHSHNATETDIALEYKITTEVAPEHKIPAENIAWLDKQLATGLRESISSSSLEVSHADETAAKDKGRSNWLAKLESKLKESNSASASHADETTAKSITWLDKQLATGLRKGSSSSSLSV